MLKVSSSFFCAIVFLAFFFQGCNNDDESNPPVVTLSSPSLVEGVYTTDESAEVEINVSVDAPNGFNMLKISFEGISTPTEEIPGNQEGQTTFEVIFTLEEIVYGSAGSFTINFQAVDDLNQTTEVLVTVQPDLPTLVLTGDNQDVVDGTLIAFVDQTFNLRYRYTFPAGFGQFRTILNVGDDTSESVITGLPPTQGNAVTDAVTNSFNQDFLGLTMSYTLEITDILGNKSELAVPIELSQPQSVIFTGVILEAPTIDKNSKSFFSTNIGQTYSVNDVTNASGNVSKEIDFGYYYKSGDNASFTGPGNFPSDVYDLGPNGDEQWATLNITNFRKTSLSEAEFDELNENSQSEINDAFENATGENKLIIMNLQEGDIIAFKTDLKNNKNPRGLFKVVNITGTDGADDSIEIDLIINQ